MNAKLFGNFFEDFGRHRQVVIDVAVVNIYPVLSAQVFGIGRKWRNQSDSLRKTRQQKAIQDRAENEIVWLNAFAERQISLQLQKRLKYLRSCNRKAHH